MLPPDFGALRFVVWSILHGHHLFLWVWGLVRHAGAYLLLTSPPCADHACKKGMVQGRLWVEGLFTSMLAACVQPSPQLYPACGQVGASSCIVIRCGEAIEKPARPLWYWSNSCV